jgi:phospholipid-binding lipoprotein MlaA
VRPWNTPIGFAGLCMVAIALTGCGTASRVRTADAPVVAVASAIPQRITPPAGTIFPGVDVSAAVSPAPTVDEAPAAVELPADQRSSTAEAEPVPALATEPTEVVVAETEAVVAEADAQDRSSDVIVVAQARGRAAGARDDYDLEEYDPWEGFNETMFEFNRQLDRYVLKPVAKVWDKVVPDEVQRMIANGFDNLEAPKRFVNSLLQGKFDGAARELSRFLLNTTIGVVGLFDVAKNGAQIEKSREDFGQSLGFYGVGPGPYLVLPIRPPSTVRDTVGSVVDGFLNPLRYLLSSGDFFFDFFTDPGDYFADSAARLALDAGEIVNDRSLNLELYQGFEETVIDMYSAVRHAYLERRRNLIKE